MTGDGLDDAIDRYHAAGAELVNGNPEPQKAAFSRRAEATLVNPTGIVARGSTEITATIDGVAARFREGEIGFERISQDFTSELAYIVEVERWQAKVGGSRDISSGALRVTSVLHPEDGTWKVLHRHADPISPIPPPT